MGLQVAKSEDLPTKRRDIVDIGPRKRSDRPDTAKGNKHGHDGHPPFSLKKLALMVRMDSTVTT